MRHVILVAMILVAFSPAVCASRTEVRDAAVSAAWAAMKQAPICCAEFSSAGIGEEITSAFKSRPLRTDRTADFKGGKAYFYIWSIPTATAPVYIQFGSSARYTSELGGYPSAYFFQPSIVTLDETFKPVRHIEAFACKPKGWLQEGETGYFGVVRIDPKERYAVIFADPSSEKKGFDFKTSGNFIVPGLTFDWQIPFGPDGSAEARIARPATLKMFRRKVNEHCRVVE